jgi:nitrogen regulatory protein P-II 1
MIYTPEYRPRTKVEAVVKDEQVGPLLNNIIDRLGGNDVSGKIFVLEISIILDIRAREGGESAIGNLISRI